MGYEKFKINYNQKRYELPVWKSSEREFYIVDMQDNIDIPIEIIKDALEDFFKIKINQYARGGYKAYAKDNYEPSNEFSYIFSSEEKDEKKL